MADAAGEAPRKQEAMQHLIKSLAHNGMRRARHRGLTPSAEKKVRDKSLKILQRWLSGKADIAPKDMLKIWCVPPLFLKSELR